MKAHYILFLVVVVVCLSSGVWATDAPAGYVGFPDRTPDGAVINSGVFATALMGLASLGDPGAAALNLSLRVPVGAGVLDAWVYDGDAVLPGTGGIQ